jgi:secreted Zn-dependent insulinase-like peptidase
MMNVLHGRFLVQSSLKSPDYLVSRINEFLVNFRKEKLAVLSDEEFDQARKALIKILK